MGALNIFSRLRAPLPSQKKHKEREHTLQTSLRHFRSRSLPQPLHSKRPLLGPSVRLELEDRTWARHKRCI